MSSTGSTTKADVNGDAGTGPVSYEPSDTSLLRARLPVVSGLLGGLVAAGLAGTSVDTIGLGAVWAGTAAGSLIVCLGAYLAVLPLQASLPKVIRRRYQKDSLRGAVAWGLGAYVFWFLIVEPALGHVGIYVPMFS